MEDLYDTKPDLFVAGMAAGASKVSLIRNIILADLVRHARRLLFSNSIGTIRC